MTDFTIAEARNNFTKLIDRALAGEDVTITRRGKAVAKIVAQAPPPMSIDVDWLERVRVDPKDPTLDFTALVRQMRDDD